MEVRAQHYVPAPLPPAEQPWYPFHRKLVGSHSRCGSRARSEPGGTLWRTGGEVKGKLANGVGSQYSHATSERGLSSITQADAHTSAASSRLNWRPHRIEWTRPFRGKTQSGFCACAITFRTSYTGEEKYFLPLPVFEMFLWVWKLVAHIEGGT